MYEWRRMNVRQREEALRVRRQCRRPWHSPPHFQADFPSYFHLSAACYEHAPLNGQTPVRMAEFENALRETLESCGVAVRAWCVLPNHWHALAKTDDLKVAIRQVGQMHGRLSRQWNQEDQTAGRKCWFCCGDRRVRSEAHFWATLNYVHHNPVHHGYAAGWRDWPFSSAAEWLEAMGEQEANRIWKSYPVLDYGKGWDDPEK